jgi:hypothetical protein
MQLKDYVFHTMLAGIGMYYTFFIVKFVTVRNSLKEEYPCMSNLSYTYQAQVIIGTWLSILILKKLTLIAAQGAL